MEDIEMKGENNELVMQFDPTTIEHLGVQMYSTLPPVIAELVSNSYDADANEVKIWLIDNGPKKIIVEDDGHGMSFNDINEKFLKIGRNRRKEDNVLKNQKSESGLRNVIGKKGIGKLSFFGIAKKVTVLTVKDHLKNEFELNWDELLASADKYKPKSIGEKDEKVDLLNGTKITIEEISRKSAFDSYNIAYSLAKTFSIFKELNFRVLIIHNNEEPIEVKDDLKYENFEIEFEWDFPLIFKPDYGYENKIKGKIISAKETVPAALKGISLFSRGKLVNAPEFYDEKATSFGFSYITGWLDIDFIDDWDKDIISTDRKSLNWEDEDASKLRAYLNSVIKFIYKEQRERKKEKQILLVQEIAGINLDEWQKGLPAHEQVLSKKMTNAILDAEGIPTQKQAELIKYVKDSFQFEAFKSFASELDEIDFINTSSLIRLMKEWELIEKREMYKLAIGRVETISKFEKYIKEKVNEVPTMSEFLKKFAWILDPRIREFKDEIYYSQLLKEKYADNKETLKSYYEELESNRRIDFLCMGIANNYFIIELKKPEFKIREKDIRQAADYRSFIESHFGNDPQTIKSVVAYVICGSTDGDRLATVTMRTYEKTGEVYIKTYHELLRNARIFHQEFIDKYELLKT